MGDAGLGLSASSPPGPVQDVAGRGVSDVDDAGEQPSDFVAAQWDERARVGIVGSPFAASWARVVARNTAATIARVMWAYQAS